MFDNGHFPLINKPTRITEKSSKTIDHIWTNAKCKSILSHIITFQVADHLLVMQSSAIGKPITKPLLRIFIIISPSLQKNQTEATISGMIMN